MAMIEIDDKVKRDLQDKVAAHLQNEFDVEMGGLEAQVLIDFFEQQIGTVYYNQALADARILISAKAELMGESLIELERFVPK